MATKGPPNNYKIKCFCELFCTNFGQDGISKKNLHELFLCLKSFCRSEKVLVSQERVSGFPEKGTDLRGSPGNFRRNLGNFWGSLGDFWGTPGLLLSSTARALQGKSPRNFWGSPGTFQKLGGN